MTPTSFEALPLAAPLQRALATQQYTVPSPIQAQAIPLLLEGRDLLGCAQTGTGKTAAFSLPILHALHTRPRKLIKRTARVLVLTPTRELATQVGKSFETYGRHLQVRHALVFGGVGQRPQVNALRDGVDVLVACPGRLLDLIEQGHLDLSGIEFFVLDEVDRMLDMGFQPDVKRIVAMLPRERQSLFFSATLAPAAVDLAHSILQNPAQVSIAPETTTCASVAQRVCFIDKADKLELLEQVLRDQSRGDLSIVFGRTKHGCDKLARRLNRAGLNAEAIHGNRSQPQRDRTLKRFRDGRVAVLVATDVAARGVDVREVKLVVNFDLPNEPEAYVHRIGRTGRAGADGHAVSFCAPDEREFLHDIEKLIRQPIDIDDDHQWHLPSLAALHLSGVRPSSSKKKKGNGGGRRRGQSHGGKSQGGKSQPRTFQGRNSGGGNSRRRSRRRSAA